MCLLLYISDIIIVRKMCTKYVCVSRHYHKQHANSWQECFARRKESNWPDILVIWNVFLLFVVAFLVNKYYEKPVISWLSQKLL